MEMITPVSNRDSRYRLRSSDSMTVPGTRRFTLGSHLFPAAAATACNSARTSQECHLTFNVSSTTEDISFQRLLHWRICVLHLNYKHSDCCVC